MAADSAPQQLAPHRFDSERARAAGRKSAANRKAKAAVAARRPAQLRQHLSTVREAFAAVDIGESVVAVAGILLARLAAGEIPVRNGAEAAELLRSLHDIARLEAGQPTSIAASVRVDGNAALDRLERLQQSARAAIAAVEVTASSAVPAADDVPHDDDEHQADDEGGNAPPVVEGVVVVDDGGTGGESPAELDPPPLAPPVCRPPSP